MVLKETAPTVEKKWLRKSIFRLIGTVHGHTCIVVKILSLNLVDRLKLKVRKLCCSYFFKWLITSDEVQVRHICRVTFAIGEDYCDIVWCNVLSMDSGDILFGHPWMYEKNATHSMRDNTYMFMHGRKQVTLHPKKPKLPKKRSISSITKEALQVHHVYSSLNLGA